MSTTVLEKTETSKTTEHTSVYCAPVALYENAEHYIVFVELPGADEKAIQVHLDKGILTVEAAMQMDLPSGAIAKYSEMRMGIYRRTLNVSDQVEAEKIEASFKSGLLKLTMPKSKGTQARKIAIKTA
jgi:HSP20 family protein